MTVCRCCFIYVAAVAALNVLTAIIGWAAVAASRDAAASIPAFHDAAAAGVQSAAAAVTAGAAAGGAGAAADRCFNP